MAIRRHLPEEPEGPDWFDTIAIGVMIGLSNWGVLSIIRWWFRILMDAWK